MAMMMVYIVRGLFPSLHSTVIGIIAYNKMLIWNAFHLVAAQSYSSEAVVADFIQ